MSETELQDSLDVLKYPKSDYYYYLIFIQNNLLLHGSLCDITHYIMANTTITHVEVKVLHTLFLIACF